ncbi:MAG TPA: 4-(cytidine 5'-diphospho)-2-C-methyl-D-erythritol kinase [Ignavibacteriales bacterium]|nr:4-(cytidine 5'-diphospho)-2-C-methyl-D-erythritol kinase [Ignavibacteriales bacterium]
MDYLEIKAPAKINFGLYVIRKREDNYHDIETIFYPLDDLYDTLYINKSDHFSFKCSDGNLQDGNLVVKAKDILENTTGKKITAEVFLEKFIPTGAGLGGGSSDAATALVSFNEMFGLRLDLKTLNGIALQLGSDVPFFLKAKPSFGEMIGERLTQLNFLIDSHILIVNPGIHVSTKEAYSKIKPEPAKFSLKKFNNRSILEFRKLKEIVLNDFENVVFDMHPEIKKIKDGLYDSGALFALMSGSGSTVYGIFKELEKAHSAQSLFPKYFTFLNEYQR